MIVVDASVVANALADDGDDGDLARLRMPTLPLMVRAYELRANVTAYDASYVALAEHVGWVLLTADARLARSSGIRCDVEVLAV